MAGQVNFISVVGVCCVAGAAALGQDGEPLCISGRYPHLTVFNSSRECGIGALAPWAGRLWFITYAPHKPGGSDDKLYSVDHRLGLSAFEGSVGGTPANRLIHRESNQLIIGPYFIDADGGIRVIPPARMPGRHTATARHLSDPANRVYFFCMEGEFYEVNVHDLSVKSLFRQPVPGCHGKGAYTGQGRLVIANNGENRRYQGGKYLVGDDPKTPEEVGVLAQWDGGNWSIVERRQFNEVTGPGGIRGAQADDEPVWATGWDKRSLMLKLLDAGRWRTFRLPIGSYCYTPAHGWYTEWPRIREVGAGRMLMNMHGTWFDFPKGFGAADASGLRPIACHLKITADFCGWRDEVVFACDDASVFENPFVNQSQSNLWFSSWEALGACGNPAGFGGPWIGDDVKADSPSHPYLFAGFRKRVVHVSHDSPHAVTFNLEIDRTGKGDWAECASVDVPPRGYSFHVFPPEARGEWIRVRTDRECVGATAYFHYGPGGGSAEAAELFKCLANASAPGRHWTGIVRPRGGNLGTLHHLGRLIDEDGAAGEDEYYETDGLIRLKAYPVRQKESRYLKRTAALGEPPFRVDAASVIITDGGKTYRLPRTDSAYDKAWSGRWPRAVREVVTERNLLNVHGAFYVLPRPSAGGVRTIKPVCTHGKRITDFCSWRGLLVLAGTRCDAQPDGHFIRAGDGGAGLWFGDVDDLWKLGKPKGHGGPWLNAPVKVGEASDPYLMTGYDEKELALSHEANAEVEFTVEVDFLCRGTWKPYAVIKVPPGRTITHRFPDGYSAHWVRLRADRDCTATALFTYR